MGPINHDKCRTILESIIASTIIEDNSRIPSSKEYILYTLVQGTIIYMKGNTEQIAKISFIDRFIRKINNAFLTELKEYGHVLNAQIKETLEQLTDPKNIDPGGPAKTYDTCEVYELFRGRNQGVGPGIRPLMCLSKTFSPEYQWLQYVRKNHIPSLSDSERKDVEGIAREMRKLWDKS